MVVICPTARGGKHLGPILVALGAGAIAVLALPPFSFIAAVPVAWSALFLVVQERDKGASFILGWMFGIAHFAVGLWWITESFMIEAETFGPLAIPAVTGLAALLSVFPALACALFARLRVQGAGAAVAFAGCWTAAEWLRGHMMTGFPWNLAGYALADYAALRQSAALVGSYGLSFLTVLAAVLPAVALCERGRDRLVPLLALAGLLCGVWVFGALRLAGPEPVGTGVQVRVVQGNVAQRDKWDPAQRAEIVARYLDLSARPGAPDLVLWPETAYPGFLDEDTDAQHRFAEKLPPGVPLLTGVLDRETDGASTVYYNTVQAYSGGRGPVASYAKHHLVPFGEYVPFRRWLPFERIVESLGEISPGPGPRTLALTGVPLVGVAICYEIIFPGHVTDDAIRPDWIFNATNDAWFGASLGPEQHLASARMRATEEGLPVVRAANTGISAVIDATGTVLARLEMAKTGIIDTPLPGAGAVTLYARFGDWTLLVFIIPFLGLWWLARIKSKRLSIRDRDGVTASGRVCGQVWPRRCERAPFPAHGAISCTNRQVPPSHPASLYSGAGRFGQQQAICQICELNQRDRSRKQDEWLRHSEDARRSEPFWERASASLLRRPLGRRLSRGAT